MVFFKKVSLFFAFHIRNKGYSPAKRGLKSWSDTTESLESPALHMDALF